MSAVLVVLILAESLCRFVFTEEEANRSYWGLHAFVASGECAYHHAPGFTGRAYRSGVFDCAVTISEEGLRQSDLAAQASFPERLLVLGDSFAFGLGVPEEACFVSELSVTLNAAGVGVINGAQCGYGLRQELAWGRRLIDRFRPTAVLLCAFPHNDFVDDCSGSFERLDVRHGVRVPKRRWARYALTDYIRVHSRMVQAITTALEQRHGPQIAARKTILQKMCSESPETRLSVTRPTLEAFDELAALCGRQGIRLIVAVIPQQDYWQFGSTPGYDDFVAHVRAAGLACLDLNEGRRFNRDHYFVGDSHWNESGHRLAADVLIGFLVDALKHH